MRTATKKSVTVKSVYQENYRKGVFFNTLMDIKKHLEQPGIKVSPINSGKNSDGTEYWTIKIDNIKV